MNKFVFSTSEVKKVPFYLAFFNIHLFLLQKNYIKKYLKAPNFDYTKDIFIRLTFIFLKMLRFVVYRAGDIDFNKYVSISTTTISKLPCERFFNVHFNAKYQVLVNLTKVVPDWEDVKCIPMADSHQEYAVRHLFNYADLAHVEYILDNYNCYLVPNEYSHTFIKSSHMYILHQLESEFDTVSFMDVNLYRLFNKYRFSDKSELLDALYKANHKNLFLTTLTESLINKYVNGVDNDIIVTAECSPVDFQTNFYNDYFFKKLDKYKVPYFSIPTISTEYCLYFKRLDHPIALDHDIYAGIFINDSTIVNAGEMVEFEETIDRLKSLYEHDKKTIMQLFINNLTDE